MAPPVMIFANGYPRPYTSDRAEIASATAKGLRKNNFT
jgi:hypothetical protein